MAVKSYPNFPHHILTRFPFSLGLLQLDHVQLLHLKGGVAPQDLGFKFLNASLPVGSWCPVLGLPVSPLFIPLIGWNKGQPPAC